MKGFNEALHDAVYAVNSSLSSIAREAGMDSHSLYHIVSGSRKTGKIRPHNAEKLVHVLAEEFSVTIERRRNELERLQDIRDALMDSYIAEYMNGEIK